ncbi:hypothetical protein N7519_002769, partial [Penicillium mononematosum]|uniref:uncharacterized protein n=1 Tax=Penicillium mononematosum TaxID=268346 RepID=UPI002548C876
RVDPGWGKFLGKSRKKHPKIPQYVLISANTLLAPGDGKLRNRVIIKFLSVRQLINVYILSGVIQSR